MKRNDRQIAIQEIIQSKEISTQSELTNELKKMGFDTTQATVSRDIKELGLVKVSGEKKKFKYAVETQRYNGANKIANIFKESVISIEASLNILVVKTSEGSAMGAAYFLDKLELPEILGTISGDDTVLIVAKAIEDVPYIMSKLKGYLQ